LESQLKAKGAKVSSEIKNDMVEAAIGMTHEMAALAFNIAGARTKYGEEAGAVVRESSSLYLEPKPYR
jgi:hypothetical protein